MTRKRSLPIPLVRLGFRASPAGQIMEEIERDVLVVLMIESALGVENAETIAAVPGVDALMMGTNDLAADMGRVGDVGHADVHAAFAKVAGAADGRM